MKNYLLLLSLLVGFPLVCFGQSVQCTYPMLRPLSRQQFQEVEKAVNAQGGDPDINKAYLFYYGIPVYEPRPAVPDSLFAPAPWEGEENTSHFDVEQAARAVKPFMDSLTISLAASEPKAFYIVSRFEAERWKNRSRDVVGPELETFQPQNDKMRGVLTAPVRWLNGARLRMTYDLTRYSATEESVLLTRINGSVNEAIEDGSKVLQGIGLEVGADNFHDIDVGMLTVEAIPPFRTYEVVKLDSSSVGKKYSFAGVDFTVTAFASGILHWKTETFEDMQRIGNRMNIWMVSGGKGYYGGYQVLNGGSIDLYNLAMLKQGLTKEEFMREFDSIAKKSWLKGAQLCRLEGMYGFDCIYLYRENTPLLGMRDMMFSKSKNYVPTYFVKNSDGVSSAVSFKAGSQYTLPEFEGGGLAMTLFFHRQMKYPPEALQAGRSGHALVEITIKKDGRIENPRLLSGADNEFAQEALRLVKLSSGRWIPASKDGQPIEEDHIVPVTFDVAMYKMFQDEDASEGN